MAYKQKNNPLKTPVLKVDMEDGVMGKANRDGSIHINKNISDPQQIQEIVEHESVHVDQMQRGDLDYDDKNVIWKGKKYSRAKMDEGAKNLPWEKEAYNKTENSPLQKRKNPPPFGIKEWLNKDKRTTNLGQSRPGLDPNRQTGTQTPGLWSEDDRSFIELQNDKQRNKGIETGFVDQFASPDIINSPTPGPGRDLSTSRDIVSNHEFFNDQTGSSKEDSSLTGIDRLGAENITAYDNNPEYIYQDYRGSSDDPTNFGSLTDSSDDMLKHLYVGTEKGKRTPGGSSKFGYIEPGYYNRTTGQKAPEKDLSKDLASSDILQPKSYNIIGQSGNVGTASGGTRTANINQGGYTTNYELKKGDRIPDNWRGYDLKQSTAITKGQKAKWDKKGGRKRNIGGQVFNADKKAKTILPKRKITYSIDSEGNQLETKRWDRKKYTTSSKYFDHNNRTIDQEGYVKLQQDHNKRQQRVINKRKAQQDELARLKSK